MYFPWFSTGRKKPVHPVFLYTSCLYYLCIIYEGLHILLENAKHLSDQTKTTQVTEEDDWKNTGSSTKTKKEEFYKNSLQNTV